MQSIYHEYMHERSSRILCVCLARLAGECTVFGLSSVIELVNTIFWKRRNRLYCQPEQVVHAPRHKTVIKRVMKSMVRVIRRWK